MLNEWSCPFALWLDSPQIRGLLSPRSKHSAYLSKISVLGTNVHVSPFRCFTMLLKSGLVRCTVFKSPQILRPWDFILLYISASSSFVSSNRHNRGWTHIYCVQTKALFCQTWKVGCTNTALSFFIPTLALGVGIAVTHGQKNRTRSVDVFPCSRKKKMSSVFKGFFFSKGSVNCSVLDLLNEV